MDDDTEDDISLTDDLKCSLIPNGPYPLATKGTFNYFNSSPQGWVSHFKSKKAAVTKNIKRKHGPHLSLFVIRPRME